MIWYVLECTPLGRHLLATGANPEAARLAGVRTDRMVWGSLVVSAVVAGLAGIIYGAKVGSFSNTFGPPLLFPAFAAVFFGSTQFKNRANVWGTIAAVYTLAFGVKGLQLAFSGGVYWITPLFNGLALLVAVALASRKAIPRLRPKAVADAEAEAAAAPDVAGRHRRSSRPTTPINDRLTRGEPMKRLLSIVAVGALAVRPRRVRRRRRRRQHRHVGAARRPRRRPPATPRPLEPAARRATATASGGTEETTARPTAAPRAAPRARPPVRRRRRASRRSSSRSPRSR